MADQLLQYIVAQEHAGYSEAQIKQALAAQGYTAAQIDGAFKALQGSQTDTVIRDYVQQYARQGTPPVQIFKALTEQGYAAGKVRKAIQEVFGPGTLPSHHTAVFLVVALLIAAGGIYFINPGGFIATVDPPEPTGGAVEFTVSDHIEQVLLIARDPSKGKDAAVQECELRLRNDNRDLCYLDVAILPEVSDDALCDRISDIKLRDTCLMQFIEAKPAACKRLSLKQNIDTCNAMASLQKLPST